MVDGKLILEEAENVLEEADPWAEHVLEDQFSSIFTIFWTLRTQHRERTYSVNQYTLNSTENVSAPMFA